MDLCGKLSGLADFENAVDRASAVIFDADSRIVPVLCSDLGSKTKFGFSLDRKANELIQFFFPERSSF